MEGNLLLWFTTVNNGSIQKALAVSKDSGLEGWLPLSDTRCYGWSNSLYAPQSSFTAPHLLLGFPQLRNTDHKFVEPIFCPSLTFDVEETRALLHEENLHCTCFT